MTTTAAAAPPYHPESGINEDLLRRVLVHVTQHREQHDQQSYGRRTSCGTTHCIAGWAIAMAAPNLLVWRHAGYEDAEFAWHVGVESSCQTLWSLGADLLGLEADGNAMDLFAGDLALEDLWVTAARLTDGRVSRADVPELIP